jgi:putative copper export protein
MLREQRSRSATCLGYAQSRLLVDRMRPGSAALALKLEKRQRTERCSHRIAGAFWVGAVGPVTYRRNKRQRPFGYVGALPHGLQFCPLS